MTFRPPRVGVYYVFFEVPSLGLRFGDSPSLILQATDGSAGPGQGTPEAKE
jgi:hypothetical protein